MSITTRFADGITSLTQKLANVRNAHHNNRMSKTRVDWEELRAIYRTGIGSKIIRLKSGMALDDTLQFDSEEDRRFYESQLQHHVKKAAKFQLAFGRALIVAHEPGANLSEPMKKIEDWTRVRYHVFSGDMVYVSRVNFDLRSPNYLKPRQYSVRGNSIHPSRCVDMKYVEPVEMDAAEYFWGGISEFELIRNELVSDGIIQRAVPSVLEKSAAMFYKIKGFKELLADKREDELLGYMRSLEDMRSVYGAGVMDQEDEIELVQQTLTNLAESDQIGLRRLAMVTGLPLSWLVGEAAAGLNSTGEGERQVIKSTITNFQSEYLLENINCLMALHGRGRVWFKDNQLETPLDRVNYETKLVQNALALWQMGEDHTKYLQDHDMIQEDKFKEFFADPEEEERPTPESPEISLEELMGGGDNEA